MKLNKGYEEPKANVNLLQMIDDDEQTSVQIKMNECDINSFIQQLREQINRVNIDFNYEILVVDIYFKMRK